MLDAPALDWQEILSFDATEMGFPSFASLPVEWAIGTRIDADWESLDARRHPDDFQLPILLFHGADDDGRADLDQRRLRRASCRAGSPTSACPRPITSRSWNVDPALYERRLGRFLGRVAP